jgi:alpha-galactosidase
MKHWRMMALAIVCAMVALPAAARIDYDARIGENEILTPAPGPAPVLNGPRVYGARPGKPFIYRIPCQGERPMRFEVVGLPASITLDPATGVLGGTTPATKGEYAMTFKAANSLGTAERPFTLVVGDTIALTPPTGFNTWGGYMLDVTDAVMRSAADIFVEKGLADLGYQYLGIDDGWQSFDRDLIAGNMDLYARAGMDTDRTKGFFEKLLSRAQTLPMNSFIGPARDAQGRPIPNPGFPDMKAMTDYIHSLGLKAGLYSTPGPLTCQGLVGSFENEQTDAKTYAEWGFDLLKYDQCSAQYLLKSWLTNHTYPELWKPMADALAAQDRDILYNLCQYGKEDPWTWAPGYGIQSWRISGDLNHGVQVGNDLYFTLALRMAGELRDFSKPGQWNDPDFIYIHYLKDTRDKDGPPREIPLGTNQRYQYVTLWSVVCAPFFISCDLSKIDDFTLGLLRNNEIFNVNQDEAGHVAEIIRNENGEVVLLKRLADGSKVVAVFNRDAEAEKTVRVGWTELGLNGAQTVRDLWRQKNIGQDADGIAVRLSPHGSAALLLQTGI